MPEERIPKQVSYGQLSSGQRSRGRTLLRYRDKLKDNFQACCMEISIVKAQDSDLRVAGLAMMESSDSRKLASPPSKKNVDNVKRARQHGLSYSSPVISVDGCAALELDLHHTSVLTDEIRRSRRLIPLVRY